MQTLPPASRRLLGFTLIELLTVMAIIAILAGLILSIASFANKKAATSRASAEIHALASACASYKTDNGTYPRQALATGGSIPANAAIPSDQLDPRVDGYSTYAPTYKNASLELYQALTGDLNNTGHAPATSGTSQDYLTDVRPDMFGRNDMSSPISATNPVQYLSDPFGNSYGYSTANYNAVVLSGSSPATAPGYNPTFDLWSVAATTANPSNPPGQPGDISLDWIKNW